MLYVVGMMSLVYTCFVFHVNSIVFLYCILKIGVHALNVISGVISEIPYEK